MNLRGGEEHVDVGDAGFLYLWNALGTLNMSPEFKMLLVKNEHISS